MMPFGRRSKTCESKHEALIPPLLEILPSSFINALADVGRLPGESQNDGAISTIKTDGIVVANIEYRIAGDLGVIDVRMAGTLVLLALSFRALRKCCLAAEHKTTPDFCRH
ncbi:hypothetical protein MesoLjLb_69230 [Mesorhizobium sp. L-8-3]|nr:hypothetical protein MesoLjLb_69230 [Mesorhizobium sp. L-8-3]